MDFSLSEEQLAYKRAVIQFVRSELNDNVIARDRSGEFNHEAFRRCARFGLQGLPIPAEYGGGSADPVTIVLAMEAFGYACKDNGLLFSINAQMWSFEVPLLEFGTEAQKRRYLPALCHGDRVAVHAMSEPESGSDAFSLRTTAVQKGDEYVLNGTKTFITNAPIADTVLVFATVDRTKGLDGISAFLVDKGTEGFRIGRKMDKMGLRSSPMAEVLLDNCRIPEEQRLGPVGAGVAIFNCSMELERSGILASYLGTMERQLEACIGYARSRKQFGRPIGRFQAIAHRLANMKIRIETARWLVYKVAWLKQQGKSAVLDAAIAKVYLSENLVQSCLDAIQIHGASGYMTELEIERDLRDSIGGTIYSGTSEIQRNIIAAWLGLPRGE